MNKENDRLNDKIQRFKVLTAIHKKEFLSFNKNISLEESVERYMKFQKILTPAERAIFIDKEIKLINDYIKDLKNAQRNSMDSSTVEGKVR